MTYYLLIIVFFLNTLKGLDCLFLVRLAESRSGLLVRERWIGDVPPSTRKHSLPHC